MSTKKMIAIISGLLAVIITAGVIFFATETQQPNQQTDTKFMGLLNSHVLDAITPRNATQKNLPALNSRLMFRGTLSSLWNSKSPKGISLNWMSICCL